MKSLTSLAVLAVVAAWFLWQLRPPGYEPFTPAGYDSPYLVLALHSAVVLAVLAALLCAVMFLQRDTAEVIRLWSSDWLLKVQLGVLACAAVVGIYGVRSVLQMHSRYGGQTNHEYDWFFSGPAATLALSPWILFAAIALVSCVALRASARVRAGIIALDIVAVLYLTSVFAHIGHWTCLSCSGPLG